MIELDKIYNEDCLAGLKSLPDESVDCCVTSPPYYALRDYGVEGQIGQEETPSSYIDNLAKVFWEVRRCLKPQGTCWVNIGDSYNGSGGCHKEHHKNDAGFQAKTDPLKGGKPIRIGTLKPKDLIGVPWMLAFALRDQGWYLRQDIIWHKPNPMPESVTDRCTKSHEYIFLLSKSQKYYFDNEAIQEPANYQNIEALSKIRFGGNKYGDNEDTHFRTYSENEYKPRTKNCKYDGQRPNSMHIRREEGMKDKEYVVRNKRDVWSVNVMPDSVAHFATYPEELIKPCILAGCPSRGIVLDPFMGSGTTARVALMLNRHFIGYEINSDYCKIIEKKIQVEGDLFY